MTALALLRHRALRLTLAPFLLTASVPIQYESEIPPGGHGEMDSVALWISPTSTTARYFITDKTENFVEVHDAIHNDYLTRIGGTGSGVGQMRRPNSVAVAEDVTFGTTTHDVLFVVERDNQRVSAWLLPELTPIGSFGSVDLDTPMGLALHRQAGVLQAWVTDLNPSPDRVFVFDIATTETTLSGALNRSFPAPGATLESLLVDAVHERVYVCDEGSASDVMVFDLQGVLQTRFGAGRFVDDPEGIVLFDLGDGDGYIIISDQNASPVQFEVFDRRTYAWISSFSGPTHGTDGTALTQQSMPGFMAGAFFAVHSDDRVHAYSWSDIASVAGLCLDAGCHTLTDTGRAPAPTALRNVPNPFNPSTVLRFELERSSAVRVQIFDLRGRFVADLGAGLRGAGEHAITWDGRDDSGAVLPSGVYVAHLQVGTELTTHKLTLVR